MTIRHPLRRHFLTRFSFLCSQKLNETVSTDYKFANCKCLGYGYIGMQVYYGLSSCCINVYGAKTKADFLSTYRNFICDHGASSALRQDNALEEQS